MIRAYANKNTKPSRHHGQKLRQRNPGLRSAPDLQRHERRLSPPQALWGGLLPRGPSSTQRQSPLMLRC